MISAMQRDYLIVVNLSWEVLKFTDLKIIPNKQELNPMCSCTLLYSLPPSQRSLHGEAAAMSLQLDPVPLALP